MVRMALHTLVTVSELRPLGDQAPWEMDSDPPETMGGETPGACSAASTDRKAAYTFDDFLWEGGAS